MKPIFINIDNFLFWQLSILLTIVDNYWQLSLHNKLKLIGNCIKNFTAKIKDSGVKVANFVKFTYCNAL